MQVQPKGVTTAKSAKDYLSKNEIPQLFECLMTGLMYHRPVDYINYLQECLEKIRKQGVNAVHWDMFLESKKTPLPPISSAPKEDFRPEPLPEIGSLQLKISLNSSIIIVQGGPGIGKYDICRKLCNNFEELHYISLGSMVRERALLENKDNNSKWKSVSSLMNDGNLAPEEFVLEILIKELNNHSDKINFLIDGYPRTMQEKNDFEKLIGINKVKFMILIDCEEEICQKYILKRPNNDKWNDNNPVAISKRIANYKANTLAVCKYFDDLGKLKVIEGDKEIDFVFRDISKFFNQEIRGITSSRPDSSSKKSKPVESPVPPQDQVTNEEITELTNIAMEVERNSDLPQCGIILLLGGPGSGKTEVASHLCQKFADWVHVDVNELLRMQVLNADTPNEQIAQKSSDTDPNSGFVESLVINIEAVKDALRTIGNDQNVIVLEGFPRNKEELNQLNTEIGRMDLVILLDSEEESMKSRLTNRFSRNGSMEDDDVNSGKRINSFKTHGLPICRYYDERSHLNIINADNDILYIIDEIEKIASNFIINMNNVAPVEEEEKEEVVQQEEASLDYDDTASTAAVTIQASIRGHLTRKRLKQSRQSNAEDLETKNESTEEVLKDDIKDNEEISTEIPNEELVEVDNEEPIIEPEKASVEGSKGVRTSSQMKLQDSNIILLLGSPGSGKKTLGDHLVTKYPMSFIHVDQLISNEINSNSENAEALTQCIESNFSDITPILSLLRQHLVHSMDVSKNIIVAGFPKTFEQYNLFVDEVALVSTIINIDVDSETTRNRLEVEADPDFAISTTEQIQTFNEQNSQFIEELKTLDIFNQINGSGTIEEVLAEASDIIDNLSFLKTEE